MRSPATIRAPVVKDDLHLLGVDPGQLHDNHEPGRVLGAVAVHRRAETSMTAAELGVPEIGDQLVELIDRLGVDVLWLALAHVSLFPCRL